MAKQKKEKKDKKGIWKEFKEFISRGNVLDLAVGIIIGGAFTAIVTALCENVLKPIINWLLALIIGTDSLDGVFTFLKKVEIAEELGGGIDLVNSIYIDWGALINAIINFLLIALVLFLIIKVINSLHDASKKAKESVQAKMLEKQKNGENAEEADAEAAAEKSPTEETPVPAPTTEELLTEIRDLLKEQPKKTKKEA